MSNVLKISCFLFTSLLIFSSCKKKIGDNEKLNEPNAPVSGYMATTSGSWWKYASRDGNTLITRNATGRDSLKNGSVFNYYETIDENTQAITPEYFAKKANSYVTLIDMDGSQNHYLMAIVQTENPEIGDEWSNTGSLSFSGIQVDALIEGKVIGTNQMVTINGQNYSNVVEVHNKLKAKAGILPYTDCGTIKMWFSKGIGVIKTDFNINIMGGLFTKQYADSLVSFHLEPE